MLFRRNREEMTYEYYVHCVTFTGSNFQVPHTKLPIDDHP